MFDTKVTGQGRVAVVFGLKVHGIMANVVMHGIKGIGDKMSLQNLVSSLHELPAAN